MTPPGRSVICPVFRPVAIWPRVRADLWRWPMVAGACMAAAACAGPQAADNAQALPARIVLRYDFAGDWAATAGDACEERPGLSDRAFLTIADVPERGPSAFHIARLASLEESDQVAALVGIADETGVLRLAVETPGLLDGRAVVRTLRLTLQPDSPRYIWLTAYVLDIHDDSDPVLFADLLANAVASRGAGASMLSEAGDEGLCLKRL